MPCALSNLLLQSSCSLPAASLQHLLKIADLFCGDCRLFAPLLARLLTLSNPNTAAVARTTVAVTRMSSGSADNILPDTGSVMFNFRLLPGRGCCVCDVLCCAVLCALLCCALLFCCGSALLHSVVPAVWVLWCACCSSLLFTTNISPQASSSKLLATPPPPLIPTPTPITSSTLWLSCSSKQHVQGSNTDKAQFVLTAGHTLDYPLQYLRKHLGKFSSRVRLQQGGGQKARPATPVSSPSSEQFHIVARAIYETVQPPQVCAGARAGWVVCISNGGVKQRGWDWRGRVGGYVMRMVGKATSVVRCH